MLTYLVEKTQRPDIWPSTQRRAPVPRFGDLAVEGTLIRLVRVELFRAGDA